MVHSALDCLFGCGLQSTMNISKEEPNQFSTSSTMPYLEFLFLVIVSCLVLALIPRWIPGGSSKEPPSLKGTIPIFSNTYQYMTDMHGFLERVA